MSAKPWTLRLLERYFLALLVVAICALVVMMGITVANVLMRYLFNAPISGAYDLVEICLPISVFLALPSAIAAGQPIVIDLIDGIVGEGTVRVLKTIAGAAGAIILAFLFWAMWKPAHDAYVYGDVKPEFGFPVWIIWAFALFGVFNSALSAIATLILQGSTRGHNDLQDGAA
ncbi:MAG TPA: TRAP transporter small permease [Ensifer sp.]|nr:TRAP transporter small permease [Ensifer sp.]